MDKTTKIERVVYSDDENIMYSYIANFYGNVANGITTINSIKVENYYNEFIGNANASKFPSYIKINGKKYNWKIDDTKEGQVNNAHVLGLPVRINNIFFAHTRGRGDDPEYLVDISSFYVQAKDTANVIYMGNANAAVDYSCSPLKEFVIDGKNSLDFSASSDSGDIFIKGEKYRCTWSLGKATYYKDIVCGSDTVSGSYVIPKDWCNQIPNNVGNKLGVHNEELIFKISLLLEGKTTEEWASEYSDILKKKYSLDALIGFHNIARFYHPTAPEDVIPSITSVTLGDTKGIVPVSWKSFIQGLSNIAITAITASGAYSSTITSVKIEMHEKDSGLNIESDLGTLNSLPATDVVNVYGIYDIDITVTDSRERTATKSAQVTFLPYSAPVIDDIVSQRCLKDGTIDNDGTYVQLSGNPVVSSCNGNNKYHIYVSYKRTDESTYNAETEITSLPAEIGTGNFDPEYSYDIQYRIVDQFNTTYFVDYVSTAIMLMHFMREGRGVAFGQKATIQNCMDVSFNALFRQNVGFEVDGKFYTISDIVKHINGLTPQESLDWVENNTKDFSNS